MVKEDCGRAGRTGVSQGQSGGGGKRVGLLRGNPLLPGDPPATVADEYFLDASDRRRSAMTVEFDRMIGMPGEHDFLAAKLADNDPAERKIDQGPVAAGGKVPSDGVQGAGALDAKAGHGPAAQRGKLDEQQRRSVGHGQRRVRSSAAQTHLFSVLVGLRCD